MVPVDRIAHRRGQAIPPVLDPLHWVVCCPTHDGRGDERGPCAGAPKRAGGRRPSLTVAPQPEPILDPIRLRLAGTAAPRCLKCRISASLQAVESCKPTLGGVEPRRYKPARSRPETGVPIGVWRRREVQD
jgi:hypothetical protein